jgi:hypothetical protein
MLPITDTNRSSALHATASATIAAPAATQNLPTPCEAAGIAPPRRGSEVATPVLGTVVEQAHESQDKARALGVDIARRQFVVQALALAAASVGLGAALAVTVLSGGAGVPLLALAGLAFSLATADTACALYEWRSKAAGGEGLPMAGDSLANVIYAVGKRCHASNERATQLAAYGSMGMRAALTVGTLSTAFFAPSPAVGTAVSALSALVRPTLAEASGTTGKGVDFIHAGQRQQLDAARDAEIDRLAAAQNDALKQRYEDMIRSLQDEVDLLKTRIDTARTRLAGALRRADSFVTA